MSNLAEEVIEKNTIHFHLLHKFFPAASSVPNAIPLAKDIAANYTHNALPFTRLL